MKVGQVIYVVPRGKRELEPVLVVEEATVKTLTSERSVTHGVQLVDGTVEHSLEKYAQDVFLSSKDAVKELTRRAVDGINALVTRAEKLASEKFEEHSQKENDVRVIQTPVSVEPEEETIEIMGPNGQMMKAHVKVK